MKKNNKNNTNYNMSMSEVDVETVILICSEISCLEPASRPPAASTLWKCLVCNTQYINPVALLTQHVSSDEHQQNALFFDRVPTPFNFSDV